MRASSTFVFLFLSHFLFSQTVLTLQDTTYFACEGVFTPDFSNNDTSLDIITVICPDSSSDATRLSIDFPAYQQGLTDFTGIYDGSSVNAPIIIEFSGNPSEPLGLVKTTMNNTSTCLTIRYVGPTGIGDLIFNATVACSNISCQEIQANISTADPLPSGDSSWIQVCTGEEVVLNAQGIYPENNSSYMQSDSQATFFWFSDNTFLSNEQNLSFIPENPGLHDIWLYIQDQESCLSDTVHQQVLASIPAPFDLLIQDSDTLCFGDTVSLTMNLDTTVYNQSNLFINPDTFPIPDATGQTLTIPLLVNGFEPGAILTDINDLAICVNIEHSWMRDLEIKLTSPDGTEIVLHDFPGSFGGEVYLGIPNDFDGQVPVPGIGFDYCWTPTGEFTWLEYANIFMPGTLPPGDYASFEPLEFLLGIPLNGEWLLSITDYWAIDNGVVFNWSIEFDASLSNNSHPSETFISNSQWLVDSVFAADGNETLTISLQEDVLVTFEAENNMGCSFDTSIQIVVLPLGQSPCAVDCSILADAGSNTFSPCEEGPVILDGFYENASGDVVVNWTTNDGNIIAGENTLNHVIDAPGVYYLEVIELDSGCVAIDSVIVFADIIESVEVTTACGGANGSALLIVSGEVVNPEILWNNGLTGPSNTNLEPGEYSVSVSANGCTQSMLIFVPQDSSCFATYSGYVFREFEVPDCEEDFSTEPVEGATIELVGRNLFTTTDQNGYYEFFVPSGDFSARLMDLEFDNFLCPDNGIINSISLGESEISENNDFYIQDELVFNLTVFVAFNPAFPGSMQEYRITYCNYGAETTDASIIFNHDELILPGILPEIATEYDYQAGAALWEIENIPPATCNFIDFELPVLGNLPFGTELEGFAVILPVEPDYYTENNFYAWSDVIGQIVYDTILVEPIQTVEEDKSLKFEQVNEPRIQAFPNPNNGSFQLSIEKLKEEIKGVRIFNLNGQQSNFKMNKHQKGQKQQIIDFEVIDFPTGLYYIELRTDAGLYFEKIILSKT